MAKRKEIKSPDDVLPDGSDFSEDDLIRYNTKVKRRYRNGATDVPIETLLELRFGRKLTYGMIAKIVGRHYQTVATRLRPYAKKIMQGQHYRKNRGMLLAIKQNEILTAMDEKKIAAASLRDQTIAYGTLYDKERLEMDKSTINVSYLDIVKAKLVLQDELKTELARLKQLEAEFAEGQ